jgi:hypothetical protein
LNTLADAGILRAPKEKRAAQFYTPRCVVRVLVEMLAPYNGRVYDPCCGSGGMFVQSVKFIESHRTGNGNGPSWTGRIINDWFMKFAPSAYRETRIKTTRDVESTLTKTANLTDIGALNAGNGKGQSRISTFDIYLRNR